MEEWLAHDDGVVEVVVDVGVHLGVGGAGAGLVATGDADRRLARRLLVVRRGVERGRRQDLGDRWRDLLAEEGVGWVTGMGEEFGDVERIETGSGEQGDAVDGIEDGGKIDTPAAVLVGIEATARLR